MDAAGYCGIGKICPTPPRVWGTDINPRHIRWCRRSYPFAEFKVNELSSSLDFPDGKFDLIYALSVFSHLDETLQLFWMEELARVVKRGGILILSVHGPSFRQVLTGEEMSRFEEGSSKTIILGCNASAAAIGTFCFWPPDNPLGELSLMDSRSNKLMEDSSLSLISFLDNPRFSGPNAISLSQVDDTS